MKRIISDKRSYAKKVNTHNHDYGQLIIPLEGRLNIESDSEQALVDHGTMYLLKPSADHAYHADLLNQFLVLDIPEYYFLEGRLEAIKQGQLIEIDERLNMIKALMVKDCDDPVSLHNLFMYMTQHLKTKSAYKSISFLDDHFDQEIEIKTLASIENYTESYYSEWFKRKTGKTVKAYQVEKRIERAKDLLIASDFSILQIAIQVGYDHQGSFSRAFKSLTGTSPLKYRIEHRV